MIKINNLFTHLSPKLTNEYLKKILKKIFWPYLCNIYIIEGSNDYKMVEAKIKCRIVPITLDNYHRVADFRPEDRIVEYREKLLNNEIGVFSEHEGKMIGSYWASINKTEAPYVVKTFFKLMPGEGLLHDAYINDKYRGLRVSPFQTCNMITHLLGEYGLTRLITDVNISNKTSIQSTVNVGFRLSKKMFYVAIFGKTVLRLVIKKYR